MIYLRIEIDNLFMFKESVLDLTYPRKLSNSSINNEWVNDFPNIKFKRVCVLSGPNASGKTTLGRVMCALSNYLCGRDCESGYFGFKDNICDTNKSATIAVHFISLSDNRFHSLEVGFDENGVLFEKHIGLTIQKSDSNKSLLNKLDKVGPSHPDFDFYHRETDNQGIVAPGFKSVIFSKKPLNVQFAWNYQISNSKPNTFTPTPLKVDPKFLEKLVRVFDSSIKEVKKIDIAESEALEIIFFNKNQIIIEDGKISNPDRLSRGTTQLIEIVQFIHWVVKNDYGIYYLDEKLAYSHTELEQQILNLLISSLGRNAQLFYTTHNYDILDMGLPTHSYAFMTIDDKYSKIVQPELLGFNKNDRSLLGYVKNDVFNTNPNTDLIHDLL